ncbi:hypothetical protein HBI23_157730 [Parastagonospora nodorum]|nr:hypothetical protein HBI47_156210 [Parastagonospora nodorum]KAH5654254.1 hypothetical protein HBI23_157730 [Parastagonospora nodorum]
MAGTQLDAKSLNERKLPIMELVQSSFSSEPAPTKGFNRDYFQRYGFHRLPAWYNSQSTSTLRKIGCLKNILRRLAHQYIGHPGTVSTAERQRLRSGLSRLDTAVNAHIVTHVIAPRCLTVCLAMQQYLPRELRDMIYKFVLDASEPNVITTKCHRDPDMSSQMTTELMQQACLKEYGHLFDPEFADSTTRKEMATSWYRCTTFRVNGLEGIRDLLQTNCWGVGRDRNTKSPVNHIVVGLRIFRSNIFFWDDDRKALKAALEMAPSFRLRNGTHIKVVMKTDIELLYQTHYPDYNLGAVMKRASLVFPMLDALLKDGHHVTVAFSALLEGHEVEMETFSVEAWKEMARAEMKWMLVGFPVYVQASRRVRCP